MKENNYFTHGIHPYHAKFIPAIPNEFISTYSKKGDFVLDPFCGSGTTLLEAKLLGRKSVGVDMNYIAVKIAKAKTFIPELDKLDYYYQCILEQYDELENYNSIIFENKNVWFTGECSQCLDKLFHLINKIEDENYKNIFEVLVSSFLKTVSNKRDVWNNGYIADNVLPNKKYTGDCFKVFKQKYKVLRKSYADLICNIEYNYETSVLLSNILSFNSKEQFDIVVTSPPYPFAVDFVKYNRLSYYWFGWDLETTANVETGSRAKRNKKNAIIEFFQEMEKIYKHIFTLVKKDGYFCMTVADTQRNKEKVSFVDWLYKIFTENNWVLVADDLRELQCQSMSQKRIKYEHKLVFQKKV